jgi:hypothetical protein
MSRKAPLAIVTMVYNERDFLPLWLRYYGGQVGLENCFVIDHGSDDGSTETIAPANRLRIPRSPLDNVARTDFISSFCSSLLMWYDSVIYCDVDEILVADPARYAGLTDFAGSTRQPVVTAFGLNVVHWLHHEIELQPAAPILPQRRWAFFIASMCKPILTRRAIRWAPGFHSADAPVAFDGLFNFHLAYVDLRMAWRRQAKRRASDYSSDNVARHHRVDDGTIFTWMENWSKMPTKEDVRLDESCPHYRDMTGRVLASEKPGGATGYRIDITMSSNELWCIPVRFRTVF